MNLRGIVSGVISSVNPEQLISLLASTGATVNATTGVATPTYATPQLVSAQIQPVSTDQLARMEQLNIQGVLRTVYINGAIASAVREDGTGGDLLLFPELPDGAQRTWLVMLVNEQWPDWCHVTVRLQNDQHSG